MSTNKEQFVIDDSGNKTAVLLEVKRYVELLEAQELESIQAYDDAKALTTNPSHSPKPSKRSRTRRWSTTFFSR